jgi:hypothetical protein
MDKLYKVLIQEVVKVCDNRTLSMLCEVNKEYQNIVDSYVTKKGLINQISCYNYRYITTKLTDFEHISLLSVVGAGNYKNIKHMINMFSIYRHPSEDERKYAIPIMILSQHPYTDNYKKIKIIMLLDGIGCRWVSTCLDEKYSYSNRFGIGWNYKWNYDFELLSQYNSDNRFLINKNDVQWLVDEHILIENSYLWNDNIFSDAVLEADLNKLKILKKTGVPMDTLTFANAISIDNLKIVKWLHKNGCPNDATSLKYAIKNKNLKMIKWLIDNKFKCDRYNVFEAIRSCDTHIVKLVVINQKISIDKYIVFEAIKFKSIDILELLCTYIDIGFNDRIMREELICTACRTDNNIDMIEWLISHGCAITVTSIDTAIQYKCLANIEWLLKQGLRLPTYLSENIVTDDPCSKDYIEEEDVDEDEEEYEDEDDCY